MPDLRMPVLSRRPLISLVAVIAGIVAIAVGAAQRLGLVRPRGSAASSKDKSIKPVAPINPDDKDAKGRTTARRRPCPVDPFGATASEPAASERSPSASRPTATRASGVYYRDRKEPRSLVADATFTETRTVNGQVPLCCGRHPGPGLLPRTLPAG